jgi:small conductance mechanosensitive channel
MTRLTDLDNRLVFIPNAKAFGDVIVNSTMPDKIRMVMDFAIKHEGDVDLALDVLIRCARADRRIAPDPAPWAKMTALNAGAVTLTLRAWTDPAGYVDTRFDLMKSVKQALEGAGLAFA